MRCRVIRYFSFYLFFMTIILHFSVKANTCETSCKARYQSSPNLSQNNANFRAYEICVSNCKTQKSSSQRANNQTLAQKCASQNTCYSTKENACGDQYCEGVACTKRKGVREGGYCVFKNSNDSQTVKTNAEKCKDLGGDYNSENMFCKCPEGSKKTSINELGIEKCEPKGDDESSKRQACLAANGKFVESNGGLCECESSKQTLVFNQIEKSYPKCQKSIASEKSGEDLCSDKKGTWDEDQKQCKCGDQGQDLAASAPACSAGSSDPEQCSEFARYEEKVKQCESESAAAVKSCDAESKNANSGYDDAKAAAAILGQVQMARGQQQGSVEACMRAGVMANTMFYGLDLMKNDCNPGMEQCKSSCNSAKEFENIGDKCYAEFIQKYGAYTQGADPAMDQKYSQFMSGVGQKMQSLQARLQAGAEKCDVEAPSKAAELNRLMKDMNNSAVQAQKCQCQQTAGQANCDDIMGPEFCLKNPTDPRCPRTVAVCSPSSADYNTKTCICMRDPKNSQCAVITGGGGGPATLAGGQGYNPIAPTGGNYSGKTGSSGGINLNGGLSDDAVAASADHSGGAPGDVFGAASTGSAGGGSTPSGEDGGAGEGSGEGEGQTKSGVAGLFNALKTGMGNLLGGGSGNKAGGTGKTFGDGSKGNGNAVDPNKWRPRGVAAVGQIGGRNENIFQKISDQYGMQSHTFMSGAK